MVSFLDKNHPACVELTMAASTLGAANAIVNFRLAGDEVDYAVNDAGAKVLLVGSELMPLVDRIRDRLTTVEHVDRADARTAPSGDAYEALLAGAAPVQRSAETRPGGRLPGHVLLRAPPVFPRASCSRHRNMVRHTINAHDGWSFEPGDKNLVAMPLFHVGGSSYVLFGIHDGIPSVMTRDPDGASLAGAILQGANRTFLVPAVLAQVLQSGPEAIGLFGRLRTYTYGAAPMPLPLLRAAIEAWPDTEFMQVYGLTELAGVITHLMPPEHRDADHPERLVSAGQCIPERGAQGGRPGHARGAPARGSTASSGSARPS